MSPTTEVLFKLLRIALGNEKDFSLPLSVNWKEVIDLSFEQGVAAIAVDGLQRLYDAVEGSSSSNASLGSSGSSSLVSSLSTLDSPELEDLKYEWFGEVMNAEQDYEAHRSAISHLVHFYESQGVKMMLLKGYGLSLNYPIPSHRPVGDIDIYLLDER